MSEDKTRFDLFQYGATTFISDEKLCYTEYKQSNWGPASSHTHSEVNNKLYARTFNSDAEVEYLFEINKQNAVGIAGVKCLVMSDNRTIVADQDGLTDIYEARIFDSSGTVLTNIALTDIPINLSTTPDESKITISTASSFRIFDKNGSLLKTHDQAGYFVWNSNIEGYFYNTLTNKLSTYNIETDSSDETDVDFKPMQYNNVADALYNIEGTLFSTLDVQSMLVTNENLQDLLPNYTTKHGYPSISPDGKNIVLRDSLKHYLVDINNNTVSVILENNSVTYDI